MNADRYGFRLSLTDIVVLILGIAIGIVGWFYVGEIALFVPFVVFNFFLFCNVFRIRRKAELLWTGLFLINCTIWLMLGEINTMGIFMTQILITLGIIIYEFNHPYYHGIFSKPRNQ